MSEIEKMYENCNIKPKQKGYCDCDTFCPYPHNKCNDECPYWKYEDEAKYPPFTAEKQIVLMRYIALNDNIDYVKYYYQAIKGVWVFVCVTVTELASEVPKVYGAYHEEFEQALAGLINNLWQDLTDTEKAEIKRILE